MTKITLEDVAVQIETVWVSDAQIKSNEWWTEAASLCRSAQAVVEAAKSIQQLNYWSRPATDNPYWDELDKALAAHARNEHGTGEQP